MDISFREVMLHKSASGIQGSVGAQRRVDRITVLQDLYVYSRNSGSISSRSEQCS